MPLAILFSAKRVASGAAVILALVICGSLFSQSQPKPDEQSYHLPQLVDITASTGIHFEHLSSPEQKFIVESMSGGVALIDYDRDGWPDIYFTNAQSVEMALHGTKGAKRALSTTITTARSPM